MRMFTLLCLATLSLGCFGDAPSVDEAGSSTSGGSDSVGSDSVGSDSVGSDSVGSDSAGSEDLGSESVGSDSSDSDSGGPRTVRVSGVVIGDPFQASNSGLAAVPISLLGDPTRTTMSAADGTFVIEVPEGQPAWLVTGPTPSSVGGAVGVEIEAGDVAGVQLIRFPRTTIDEQVAKLQMQDLNVEYDDTKGAVAVLPNKGNTVITMDPMPPPIQYFAIGLLGGTNLGENSSDSIPPLVVFFNLSPSMVGAGVEVAASLPMHGCNVPLSRPPVLSDHFVSVNAFCD